MMTKKGLMIWASRTMLLLAALSLVLFQACKDKDDDDNNNTPAVDPYTGFYTYGSASFVNDETIIIGQDTLFFPAGSDASAFVQPGLLGSAPCQDPANAALELRSNFESYYACLNESNSLKQGTWAVSPDRKTITLNLQNPVVFAVFIENVTLQNNVLQGVITNLIIPGTIPPKIVQTNITFNKVQ